MLLKIQVVNILTILLLLYQVLTQLHQVSGYYIWVVLIIVASTRVDVVWVEVQIVGVVAIVCGRGPIVPVVAAIVG